MYIAYYGRPGDQAGLDFWANQVEEEGGFDLVVYGADDYYRGNIDTPTGSNPWFDDGYDGATRKIVASTALHSLRADLFV